MDLALLIARLFYRAFTSASCALSGSKRHWWDPLLVESARGLWKKHKTRHEIFLPQNIPTFVLPSSGVPCRTRSVVMHPTRAFFLALIPFFLVQKMAPNLMRPTLRQLPECCLLPPPPPPLRLRPCALRRRSRYPAGARQAVGIEVEDAEHAYEQCTAHGAVGVQAPTRVADQNGRGEVVISEVRAVGDVVLRFISFESAEGSSGEGSDHWSFLPNFEDVPPRVAREGFGLQRLDHAVLNVWDLLESVRQSFSSSLC